MVLVFQANSVQHMNPHFQVVQMGLHLVQYITKITVHFPGSEHGIDCDLLFPKTPVPHSLIRVAMDQKDTSPETHGLLGCV